jgi:type I pantothenate kinase
MERSGVAVVVEAVRERDARLVAVTGGVAAGKSTFAAALVPALAPARAVAVASDGFLLPAHPRKGFPESYDAAALAAFVAAARAGERSASAPVYSHRTYDLVPGERTVVGDADVVIVEGLHLDGPELGVRDRFDLVVHLDADEHDLERWYLARFRELRTAAETDPAAFLHPYVELGGEALDAMALDVWQAVNVPILRDHVRPAAAHADLVLRLGPDHSVVAVEQPAGS